jgi:oligopeptide/dipeptide ABC transporter ATP-binding protein
MTRLLEVRNVVQEFVVRGVGGLKGGTVHAVSDVSFDLDAGETLGIVGETGSGKSTLARCIVQAPRPKSGSIRFEGTELVGLRGRRLHRARRQMQMVFQDPYGSLNPRWRITDIVEEPLIGYGDGDAGSRRGRVHELLDLVGLNPDVYGRRHPRELSGGQCQRVAIARAIALHPALIVCDEPVSSLDVLIQAQVLNLLERLRTELGLSYLFISHDLALVKQVSDRVAVMHLGHLCEVGPAEALYRSPRHPYTVDLLASIPSLDPNRPRRTGRAVNSGEPPSPLAPPSGCRYRTRCPRAEELCAVERPMLRDIGPNHQVACHFPEPVADADSAGTATGTAAAAVNGAPRPPSQATVYQLRP